MIARMFRFKSAKDRRATRQTTNRESPQLRTQGRDRDTALLVTGQKRHSGLRRHRLLDLLDQRRERERLWQEGGLLVLGQGLVESFFGIAGNEDDLEIGI